MQMIHGGLVAQIVATVARLGLPDRLTAGPRSGAELAQATGADPDGLSRLLRAAATTGLVDEVGADRFTLTPLGAALTTTSPAGALAHHAAIAIAGRGQWRCVERMLDAVMTGQPVAHDALGMGLAAYYQDHPEEGAHFTAVTSALLTRVAAQVMACYDASGFTRIVDVGGGQGGLLPGLLAGAPRATGVLFDRPEVIATARAVLIERGLAGRITCVSGDALTAVPPGGDLYVLNSVLRDRDDVHTSRILANCHRAAPPGSALLVVEILLPAEPTPSHLHLSNLAALLMFGGRLRTGEQYQALLHAAGYRLQRVIPLPAASAHFPWHLLQARRP